MVVVVMTTRVSVAVADNLKRRLVSTFVRFVYFDVM
jgi:hypothetical protein